MGGTLDSPYKTIKNARFDAVYLLILVYPAKIIDFNFQPLAVVSSYCDQQLHLAENYSYMFDWSTN